MIGKCPYEHHSEEWLQRIAEQLQSLADENIQLKARIKHLEKNL